MEIINRSCSLRALDNESRKIVGQAVVFDSWSRDLGGFQEIIRSSSITQELVDNSDIIMNVNHDDNQMLARWNRGQGTLKLELKEDGLWFEFDAPTTARGDELLYNVRVGNLYECSFAFSLPMNDSCQRWYKGEDGGLKREIFEIGGLYDCSVVTTAAYPATSVANRENIDVDAIKRSLDEQEAAKRAEEERVKKQEINTILNNKLESFYKNISL